MSLDISLFPSVLDNTTVSAYRSCPKKFWWRHLLHLQKGEVSIHLHSGGAFAKGLEVTRKCYFDKGMSYEESLHQGVKALILAYGYIEPHPKYAAKSVFGLIGALAYYFEVWPIDRIITPYQPNNGDRHTIEWNFALPIPGVKHPDTGADILYCGRFDMVGKHDNGLLLGEDDKTTTQLGESWFNRWRLSNQVLGYTWGALEFGFPLGGFNLRGISLLKNSYGQADAVVLISKWQVQRFVVNLKKTVQRMISDYVGQRDLNSEPEMDMGGSCSAYGGCDYLPLCESPDPETWIEPNYIKNPWNPLASRD